MFVVTTHSVVGACSFYKCLTAYRCSGEAHYELAYIYAGEAVGLVTRQQSAGDVIQYLGDGAERLLRERSSLLLGGCEASREEQ